MFLLPVVAGICVFAVAPLINVVYHALTEWSALGSSRYVGLRNFRDLAASTDFRRVLLNNAVLACGVVIWVAVPFLVAVLLYGHRGAHTVRVATFVPVLMPPVVVGTVFRVLLKDSGPVNGVLGHVGLHPAWLSDDKLVLVTVVLVIAWAVMGNGILFYSSALAAMPTSVLEAARMDGASWWAMVWHVYRPQLRPVTRFWALVLTVATVAGFFPWIFGLTQGGPGVSSTTLDYLVYSDGLQNGNYGRGSAVAVVSILFLVVLFGLWGVGIALRSRRERRD